MAAKATATAWNVLIPIYTGFNALDVGGPLDVLCNFAGRGGDGSQPSPYQITITGVGIDPIAAYEYMQVKPDCTFDQAIGQIQHGDFDVLLVPGAGSGIKEAIAQKGIIKVIQAFAASDNSLNDQRKKEKWIVSICTGAIILGAAGVFKDLVVTTHWAALSTLAETCEAANAVPKSIIRKRWIDGGLMAASPAAKAVGVRGAQSDKQTKTRVVSSGGISCGLDCTLWFVAQTLGLQQAMATAEMMDYNWNLEWPTLFGVDGTTAANSYDQK